MRRIAYKGVHMCGIAGVASVGQNAVKETYNCLERLEYRGYDSVGIAAVCAFDKLSVVKRTGSVSSVYKDAEKLSSSLAIGHTRWATHGAPCQKNAHPHVSGKIAIVHNGVIDNYLALKAKVGGNYLSETDSEVIAKLIDCEYSRTGNLLSAVADAAKRLKGSFAFAVLCVDFCGIIAVKYKSNAVIGFGDGQTYLVSDISALPQSVESACVLCDGDIAVLTCRGAETYDFNLNPVSREKIVIPPQAHATDKDGYPHFMIKEIMEGERTVKNTVEGVLQTNSNALADLLNFADRIILTGCGTAYNAALVACRYFSEAATPVCTAYLANELKYQKVAITPKTLLVVITQSGETADVVTVAEQFKSQGASVIAITNCGYSAITRVADAVVPVCAGAEICVAATKSYLGQLAAAYALSALFINSDINISAGAVQMLEVSQSLVFVHANDLSASLAAECAKSKAVFFLGRGYDYDIAVEAALKLKEVSYIFSDGYSAGELKHGTLALVDENTLSVLICGDENLAGKTVNTARQILSRKGRVAVITNVQAIRGAFEEGVTVWFLPECLPQFFPFVAATALQLVAYRTAVLLGRNPDKPRNLAKSVTVE